MCFIHKWTKWKDRNKGRLIRQKDDSVVGNIIVQERRCKKCNKVQLRNEMVII